MADTATHAGAMKTKYVAKAKKKKRIAKAARKGAQRSKAVAKPSRY